MGARAAAAQFNTPYIMLPLEILGKGITDGSSAFAPNGKRMRAKKLFTLSLIRKVRDTFGSLVKLPYSAFTGELGQSRATTARALKELTADKFINRGGQSDYTVAPKFKGKSSLIIYNFLLKEKLELNNKVAKKLTGNAVILLCNIISVYLKMKKNVHGREKYFVGGVQRAASCLNVATSTANDVIHELIDVGAIYPNRYIEDCNGNVTLQNGFGVNADMPTVYLVNGKLLKRCREELKAVRKARKAKAELEADVRQEKEDQATFKQHSKRAAKRESLIDQARRAMRREEIYEEYIVTLPEEKRAAFKTAYEDRLVYNITHGIESCYDEESYIEFLHSIDTG